MIPTGIQKPWKLQILIEAEEADRQVSEEDLKRALSPFFKITKLEKIFENPYLPEEYRERLDRLTPGQSESPKEPSDGQPE